MICWKGGGDNSVKHPLPRSCFHFLNSPQCTCLVLDPLNFKFVVKKL